MAGDRPAFVLGGYQSDFARNATKEGRSLVDLLGEAACGALESASVDPVEVTPSAPTNPLIKTIDGLLDLVL